MQREHDAIARTRGLRHNSAALRPIFRNTRNTRAGVDGVRLGGQRSTPATRQQSARRAARTGLTALFCAIRPSSVEKLCKTRGRPVHDLSAINIFRRDTAQFVRGRTSAVQLRAAASLARRNDWLESTLHCRQQTSASCEHRSHHTHDSRTILRHRSAARCARSMARADRPRARRHDLAHALLRPDARRGRGHAGRMAQPRGRTTQGGIVRAVMAFSTRASGRPAARLVLLASSTLGAATTPDARQTLAAGARPRCRACTCSRPAAPFPTGTAAG